MPFIQPRRARLSSRIRKAAKGQLMLLILLACASLVLAIGLFKWLGWWR